MPNGAFYGTKKACLPINLVYNYKDKDIYLTNQLNSAFTNLKADDYILPSLTLLGLRGGCLNASGYNPNNRSAFR